MIFADEGKLAAYFGIVPRVSNSNEPERSGRITKRGSKLGRTALVQYALIAQSYSPYLKRYYEKIKARRGTGKAIIALARKLLGIIYRTLKNKWVFEDFPISSWRRWPDARGNCWMPRAENARGKVLGAPPRTPARGTPPEISARFPFRANVPERSSLSTVRFAAHKPRTIDNSGPFRTLINDNGKRANANRFQSCGSVRHPLVGPDLYEKLGVDKHHRR